MNGPGDNTTRGTAADDMSTAAGSVAPSPGLDPAITLDASAIVQQQLGQLTDDQLDTIQKDLEENVPDAHTDTIFAIDDAARIALKMRETNSDLWGFIEARLDRGHQECGRDDLPAANARFWLLILIVARLTGRSASVDAMQQAANTLRVEGHTTLLVELGCPLWSETNTRQSKKENRAEYRRRLRRRLEHKLHHFEPVEDQINDAWSEPVPWAELEALNLHIPVELRALGAVTYGMLIGLAQLQSTFCVDDREHRTSAIAIDETKLEAWADENKNKQPYGDPDATMQKRTPVFSDRRRFVNGFGAQVGSYTNTVDRRHKPADTTKTDTAKPKLPLINGIFTFTAKMQHPVLQAAPATALLHAFHRRENLPTIDRLIADKGYTQKPPEKLYRGLQQHGIDIVHHHYPWMSRRIAIGTSSYSFEHGRLYRDTMFTRLRDDGLHELDSPETGRTKKIEIEERLRRREIEDDHTPGSPEHEAALAVLATELAQLDQRLQDLNDRHAQAATYSFQFSHYQHHTDDDGNRTVKALTYQGPHKARTAYCHSTETAREQAHRTNGTPYKPTPVLKNGTALTPTGCAPQHLCPHRTRAQCIANGGCYHKPDPTSPLLGPTNTHDCETETGNCDHEPACWRDHSCNCGGTFTIPAVNPIEQINATSRAERTAARNLVPSYDETTDTWTIEHLDPTTNEPVKIVTDSPLIERLLTRTAYGSPEWNTQLSERNRPEGTFGQAKGTLSHDLKRGGIKQRGEGSFAIFALSAIVKNQIIILINNRIKNDLPRFHWPNYRAKKLRDRTTDNLSQIDATLARLTLNEADTPHETPTQKRHRDSGPPDPGPENQTPTT